jgi:predicted transcriptional regulator
MVKISANIENTDAASIKRIAETRNWKQSDIIRKAIHQYCEQADKEKDARKKILRETKGIFKDSPIDADSIRAESNAGARL